MEKIVERAENEVWIVDDEEELTEICARILEPSHKTRRFNSPIKVLEAIESGLAPSTLVVDLRMPQLDGLSLVGKLKEKGLDIPTVVISGNADVSKLTRALRLGVRGYVEKPFENVQLAAEVARVAQFSEVLQSRQRLIQAMRDHMVASRVLLDKYFERAAKAENILLEAGLPIRGTSQELKAFLDSQAEEAEIERTLEDLLKTIDGLSEGLTERGHA